MNIQNKKRRKTILLLLGLAALSALGIVLGRSGYLSSSSVNSLLFELGCWAVPSFLLLFVIGGLMQVPGVVFVVTARLAFGPILGFVVGGLMQIPGVVFVVTARLAFGPLLGFAVAYVGAILMVTAGFLLIRILRGKKTGEEGTKLPFAWAQRMLEKAETRPVTSVAVLRLLFFLSPPLNMGLGFSDIRTRHYVLGSALGLAAPVALVTIASGLF
jgi:uncharacterized membrane protein YdjX (TVP38/TMEM64 family)